MELSAFLDILHSGIPDASKDFVFKSILDEDTYQQLLQWQLSNNQFLNQQGPRTQLTHQQQQQPQQQQQQHGTSQSRPRRRVYAGSPTVVPDQEGFLKRSFLVSASCKSVIIGPNAKNIKEWAKQEVFLVVEDKEDSKIEVTVSSKDAKALTLAVLTIWDTAGRIMKIQKLLNKEQTKIILDWSDEKRAGFIIRTGCNLHLDTKKNQTTIQLKATSAKEADAAIAQILVEHKNTEESEEFVEDEEDDESYTEKFKPLNILLIGMEAVGKSLLINGLVNYLKYNRFGEAQLGSLDIKAKGKHIVYDKKNENHDIGFVDCNGEDELAEMPMIYTFNGVVKSQPCEIRLIDTEGIRVSGVNESLAHVDAIVEATRKLGEIHAVVLVMKAGDDRLETNFSTVVKKLLRSFHRDLQRNILFCFTRSGPNFTHELISPVVKKFTEQMHQKEDIFIQFSKESSFCLDNKGFLDLYASKQEIDVELKDASDYWDKSAEEAKRLFEKVSELPIFDARRVVPTLPENLQIRPLSVANLGERLNQALFVRDVLEKGLEAGENSTSMDEVKNTAARQLLDSDLEANIITQLLKIGGPDSDRLLKKIIRKDDWEMFWSWKEVPLSEKDQAPQATVQEALPEVKETISTLDLQQASEARQNFDINETDNSPMNSTQFEKEAPLTLVLNVKTENPVQTEKAVDIPVVSQAPPTEKIQHIVGNPKLAAEISRAKFKTVENSKAQEKNPDKPSTSKKNTKKSTGKQKTEHQLDTAMETKEEKESSYCVLM